MHNNKAKKKKKKKKKNVYLEGARDDVRKHIEKLVQFTTFPST